MAGMTISSLTPSPFSEGSEPSRNAILAPSQGETSNPLSVTPTEQDSVIFSPQAREANAGLQPSSTQPLGGTKLSPEEQAQVQQLKQVDQEVRRHEQAHLAAAGGYARGGANFSYTTGPDGKQYATGGEVSIDVSAASTPQATVQKMEIVKRAALAPANPSSQDRAVYAAATRAEFEAQQAIAEQRQTQETEQQEKTTEPDMQPTAVSNTTDANPFIPVKPAEQNGQNPVFAPLTPTSPTETNAPVGLGRQENATAIARYPIEQGYPRTLLFSVTQAYQISPLPGSTFDLRI